MASVIYCNRTYLEGINDFVTFSNSLSNSFVGVLFWFNKDHLNVGSRLCYLYDNGAVNGFTPLVLWTLPADSRDIMGPNWACLVAHVGLVGNQVLGASE